MAFVLSALVVLLISLGGAGFGFMRRTEWLVVLGLAISAVLGLAIAVHANRSIASAEAAYERLDAAMANSEQLRDELLASNEELSRSNVELRTMHVAMADVLNLTDERTDGRLRELVEGTGWALAQLLDEELSRSRER